MAKHTKVIKNTVSSAHVKDANFPHNVHEHMNTHTYKHSKHTRTHTYTYTYALVGIVPLNLVAAAAAAACLRLLTSESWLDPTAQIMKFLEDQNEGGEGEEMEGDTCKSWSVGCFASLKMAHV